MILTGQQLLKQAVAMLGAAGVADAARDARRLFAHAAGVDASRVTLIAADAVSDDIAQTFRSYIARRCQREPVSHIIGERAFYGASFEVGPDVLDPRPETEVLVQAALDVPFGRVLDLGTGSGCIIATLLAARGGGAYGVATDLSTAALAVAQRNAARLQVADRIAFYHGSWFAALPADLAAFDVIVSNPPYIAASEMAALAPEVTGFEPRMALTDDGDGLQAYRNITGGARSHLRAGGWLMCEIGPTQGVAVAGMLRDRGFAEVTILPDLDGRDRVVIGQTR